MKLLGAALVAFLSVGCLCAQYRPAGGFGSVVFPGGFGVSPTGNPWGNVVTPATPQGAAVIASGNRYGSLIGGFGSYGAGNRAYHRSRSSSVYAFPVFVGGYGYAPDQGVPPPPDAGPGNAQAPPPAVVINQYFGTPPPNGEGPAEAPTDSNFHYYQTPVNTNAGEGTAAPTPDPSYYLIAFKDHTIYPAVAYYTDGDTLHYFTSGNVHNQVSLSLVDRQLTEQLNRQHNMEVRLPN